MLERILGNIYISSFEPIEAKVDFKVEFGISHIVSVISGSVPSYLSQNYKHYLIDITDESTTNLLEHLDNAINFIDDALSTSSEKYDLEPADLMGAVLVHCAQGQSRSVAVVIAYLMYKHALTYKQAFYAVKRKITDAEPNPGFVKQLRLFNEMGCKVDKENHTYKEFVVRSSLEQDPTGVALRRSGYWQRKKDANDTDVSQGEKPAQDSDDQKCSETVAPFNLRCKRCTMVLARNLDVLTHEIPEAESRQAYFFRTNPNSRTVISSVDASKKCSHYFMNEPVAWMEPELNKQEMEGKLACPKCNAKVGGYSWKGSRCSCGKWIIPALHLQSAKVDLMSV